MGILDDVFVNAKSAAGTVSKKAGEFYDLSKLKLSETNLKSELNKKYQAYGKAVYFKEDRAVIDKLEDEIAELNESLADVQKLYEAAKNNDVCKICGQKVPKGSKFCPVCGAKYAPTTKACPKCNKNIENNAVYCAHCGEKITK